MKTLMLPVLLHTASVMASAATPAAGRFDGILDMSLSLESGGGDMQLSVSGDDARLDMKISVNPLPEPLQLSILLDAKSPKRAWLVSDKQKTYSEIDLGDVEGLAPAGQDKGPYKVKVLGKGRFLELDATHVTLTRGQELVDAWITPELPDVYAALKRLQQANPQIGEAGLFQALEKSGHKGLPLRCTVIREGQRVTTEVRKISRKPVPASVFAVPSGYSRAAGTGAVGIQPTPEQVEEMKKLIEGTLQGQ